MSETRVIKKYPNRRLYDTAISSYITLEDVRRLIVDNIKVEIIEARTKQVITHNTLMQILLEQEDGDKQIFSTDILQKIICCYKGNMQNVLGHIFTQSVDFFNQQQQILSDNLSKNGDDFSVEQPLSFVNKFSEENIVAWEQLQKNWVENFNKETLNLETAEKQTTELSENVVTAENVLPASTVENTENRE